MPAIEFDHIGIGDLIRRGRLAVPLNQRSYAWEEQNVLDLLQDVNGEMNKAPDQGPREYFLGTIVLVDNKSGPPPQISDGQQRLATTTIVLSRIRDILRELGQVDRAEAIQREFIAKIDFVSGMEKSQITLNQEDDIFFSGKILSAFPHNISDILFLRASNKRLLSASKTAYDYLRTMLSSFNDELKPTILIRWVQFLKENTHLVVVTVQNENDAFRLFETLNDRGVKAGQVDILKNFFLQQSGEKRFQTHVDWTSLGGKIEANFPDNDEQLILYLRHLWIMKNGHTTEKDLSTKIRAKIVSEPLAVTFVNEANSFVTDYIALSEPNHPKWLTYKNSTREYLNAIATHLKVVQIKPLLFAIARTFSAEEGNKAFRLCVSASVRFLVYGGRGGFLDEHYAVRTFEIGTGKITTAAALRESMLPIIPTDTQFEGAFASARVSKAYLARYYLRALEKTKRADPDPEFVANEDYNAANLEHIIPITPGPEWHMAVDDASGVQQLLGNMTLLSAKKNVDIGNASFKEKLAVYKDSAYKITNELEQIGEIFGVDQVKQRQAELAKIAVQTWSLKFD